MTTTIASTPDRDGLLKIWEDGGNFHVLVKMGKLHYPLMGGHISRADAEDFIARNEPLLMAELRTTPAATPASEGPKHIHDPEFIPGNHNW